MDSKLYLTFVVLGLTALITVKGTALGTVQGDADTYQQDLTGEGYTGNTLKEHPEEIQRPFYYNNNFDCTKYQYSYGMYADMDFQCQVYHVCHNNRKETFLCPQGTLFNQRLLVCDHWYSVSCRDTPSFYYANQELGKMPNRTRFDIRGGSYPPRRLPEDYNQHAPNRATFQGQRFPTSDDGSAQLPPSRSTGETPIDNYHSRHQANYSSRSQSSRYYPQPPVDQTTNQVQPQTRLHFSHQGPGALSRDQQSPGLNHQGRQPDNRQNDFNYLQQTPHAGSLGLSYGSHQSGLPGIRGPGTQQNRDLTFTHYSQSGARWPSQGGRTNNTWPFVRYNNQRNDTQGVRNAQQPPSFWRYRQNYPEDALLGSSYGVQKPSTSQYGQHPTPAPEYGSQQPSTSNDGYPHSQVLVPGVSYDSKRPSSISPHGQVYPPERSPGSYFGGDQVSGVERGQTRSELDNSALLYGSHNQTSTQYGRQLPQSGSTVPPNTPHHPFTTHRGQIHSQARTPGLTYRRQHSSQLGYDKQQPPFTSQFGWQQPHIGAGGSLYGEQPLQGRKHPDQRVTHYGQNQSDPIPSSLYGHQQPNSRPGYSQAGLPLRPYNRQQTSTEKDGQDSRYISPTDVQRNRTGLYNHQVSHEDRISEFSYPGQLLHNQPQSKPESIYSDQQNETSVNEDKRHDLTDNRQPKRFQSSHWEESWKTHGTRSQFLSQGSQSGGQESDDAQGRRYLLKGVDNWQKPGSPRYSFQQPPYRNIQSSGDPANPSHLKPISVNGSSEFSVTPGHFSGLEQSAKDENKFWNHQSGIIWNVRGNKTIRGPVETQAGNVVSGKKEGSQSKNLKPILVYQHQIPISINGNATNSSGNRTDGSAHQQIPVYKVYYVRGNRK